MNRKCAPNTSALPGRTGPEAKLANRFFGEVEQIFILRSKNIQPDIKWWAISLENVEVFLSHYFTWYLR